jgi:hypothetical protein
MQGHILVVLLLSIAFTDGFVLDCKFILLNSDLIKSVFLIALVKPKCPIKKYKPGKYITGYDLLLHQDLHERVKYLEILAKDCRVHLNIKGSYYQLATPTQYVPSSDYDLVIGHGIQFVLHEESNQNLCNKQCLSNSININ